ncbi:MAG: hypothetical protein KGL43_11840 [Burkholderiales bacterium]|nr:hypothetical protein [Burkholderiales bacterium]
MTLNQKVLIWARGKLGQQVGRGECWDLGESALSHAGAQTSNDLGPVGDDEDYIWGDPVSDLGDVQPSDLLQIRDHVATTTTQKDYEWDDGSTESETATVTAERGHHTAIVVSALDAKGQFRTLEQHVKPLGKWVQNKVLPTTDQDPVVSWSKVKRKNPSTGKVETAKVTTTVTVTVTGTIWAYHPKAK